MQTSFVTYRFLDIKELDMKSRFFPEHKPEDYIGEHMKGTLDTPILDVCECKCDDMKVEFKDYLFVFRTGEPVRDEHTPRSLYLPSGDFVNIYFTAIPAVDMSVPQKPMYKKEAYMCTIFDSMMIEMNRQWNIMNVNHKQRTAMLETMFEGKSKKYYLNWQTRGCKYDTPKYISHVVSLVATQEGVRRARIISHEEFDRLIW